MRWKEPLALAVVLLISASPEPASAQGQAMVFARVDDLSSLRAQRFYGSYAFETGRRFLADDTTQATNLKHRFSLAWGVSSAVQLSVMQVIKHHLGEEVRPGVLRPQVRLGLGTLLPDSVGAWPQDLSLYFAPRVRFNGRRDSSLVLGIGTRTQPVRKASGPATPRRWVLTANTGLEVSVPESADEGEVGLRYDLGAGYSVLPELLVGFETWGHATWSKSAFSEQEHAFGPTLSGFLGPARLGINGSVRLREFPGQSVRVDVRGTFVAAMQL